jgi:catalase
MDEKELKEKIKEVLSEMSVWSGHQEMTMQEIAVIQPSLGRIMPEIGDRTWKLYYAAKERNWVLAKFEWKEIQGLMELAGFTRPKYEESLNQFMREDWAPLGKAIDTEDFEAFDTAFHKAIEQANAYHELKDKPYIRWQLPSQPPPDMDLKPRGQ